MIMARSSAIRARPVNLRFVEKARLDRGKVMLYRAHRDMHLQLPADDMSVSLNILETSSQRRLPRPVQVRCRDQPDRGGHDAGCRWSRCWRSPPISAATKGTDLLADFAAGHPSDRVRWFALRARAAALPTLDERLAVFARGRAPTACWSPRWRSARSARSRPAGRGSRAAAAGRWRSSEPRSCDGSATVEGHAMARVGFDLRSRP